MKNKTITWIAFALLVLLQLWVPAAVIRKKEDILSTGATFKFRTAPVDPNDYLRGKFVYLSFSQNSFEVNSAGDWRDRRDIFVNLGTDSAGFAKILSVSKDADIAGQNYIKATLSYVSENGAKTVLHIDWPFDRFYMEESKAPLAEKAYNDTRMDSSITSYALVKVKHGNAVLANVYIDDKPIDLYIKK